uniref:MgtC/SapB family protein n=1 Tax=Dictyoglomus thermophilum TaxID=14 RepID=A0A7C3MJ76_DICTH
MIQEFEIIKRLIFSLILSGIIGWEREKEEKPAGFRTHILVSLGATLFMIVSAYAFPNTDPTRIAAQVVTGIGFIGAGTILRNEHSVKGLTTAASIWAVSGIGMAVGAGLYFPAFFTTLFILAVLILATKLEKVFIGSHRDLILKCKIEDKPGVIGEIGTILGELKVNIKQIGLNSINENIAELNLILRLPSKIKMEEIVEKLSKLSSVKEIDII